MFFCKKLLFALYLCSYSSSIHRHSVILLCNNLNICTYENHGGLPNLMLAIFLAPLYILINIYIVRWMILWMGACTHFFQTFAFRACFVGVYIFLSTSSSCSYNPNSSFLEFSIAICALIFLRNLRSSFVSCFLRSRSVISSEILDFEPP